MVGIKRKKPASLIMIIMITGLWFLLGCFPLREACRALFGEHWISIDGQRTYFRSNINPIVAPRNLHQVQPLCRQGGAALVFSALTPHPSQALSSECAAIFQKAFLKRRVFKVIERFSHMDESEETLMARVREKGFDLLVQGRVSDFFLLREPGRPGLRFPSRSIT